MPDAPDANAATPCGANAAAPCGANPAPAPPGSAYQRLTSAGPAAIATVRVFGPATGSFLHKHVRRTGDWAARAFGQMVRAELLDFDAQPIDDVLITVHADPPAWDLRLHTHGSRWIVDQLARALERAGIAPLEPAAEPDAAPLWPGAAALDAAVYRLMPQMLTLRGVQWLARQRSRAAEALAVADAPGCGEAGRRLQRVLRSRRRIIDWFVRPLRVAVVGPPNAGKSTLVNALVGDAVSIVSPRPGTTRDWIEAPAEVHGMPVLWLDTAGLREPADPVEAAGVALTRSVSAAADAVLLVLDGTDPAGAARFAAGWRGDAPTLTVINKADAAPQPWAAARACPRSWRRRLVVVSARQGAGLRTLAAGLLRQCARDPSHLTGPVGLAEVIAPARGGAARA